MKNLRWICAGALVGLAGVIALSISAAPSRPTAGSLAARKAAPVVAALPALPALPAPPVVATTPVVATPAAIARVPAKAKALPGIVPGSAGLLIALDPETGEVGMPSPEQVAAMGLSEEGMVSHEGDGLTVVQHANGMRSVDLQGRFQEFVVARKTADGKVVVGCVDNPKHADHIQPAPAAGLEEE